MEAYISCNRIRFYFDIQPRQTAHKVAHSHSPQAPHVLVLLVALPEGHFACFGGLPSLRRQRAVPHCCGKAQCVDGATARFGKPIEKLLAVYHQVATSCF